VATPHQSDPFSAAFLLCGKKGVLRWAEAEPQVRVVLIFFLFLRGLPDFFDM